MEFVLTNAVTTLQPSSDAHRLGLSDGSTITATAVVIASGVDYRRLDIPGVDRLLGAGVFYGAVRLRRPASRAKTCMSSVPATPPASPAAHLADHAHGVTLLVRGGAVTASMSRYLARQLERTDNVHIRPGTQVERVDGEWLSKR